MDKFLKFGNTGKTIVFMPGGNIDLRCYLPLIKLLSQINTVYAISFLEINSKSVEETIDIVESFITQLHHREIILIGHSFGADIAKQIKLDCVSKYILINSSILKIKDNKLKIIFKVIKESLCSPSLADFYLITNLIVKPIKTIRHIRQALNNVTSKQVITIKNNKNVIISTTKDYLFPASEIPEDKLKDIILVEGNHNWLINEPQKSSKLIIELIDN